MATSAAFTTNGSATVQAHSVAYGATVTFALVSLTGINTIEWSIISTSKSDQAVLVVTPAGTPTGATATVTMPSDPGDGLGRSFIVKCRVTNAADSAVHYAVFGVANSAGIIPLAAGEEAIRNATHGWTDVFNQALNAIGGAAGSTSQLLYNNAGSIDGASGITVVGSETALAFGASPAVSGYLRTPSTAGTYAIVTRNAANSADINVLGCLSDDAIRLGDATDAAAIYLDVKTGGFFLFRVNSTDEFSFSPTALDMNGNHLQEVGNFDHDGANIGFFGTAPTTKKTVTGSRGGNAALASFLTQLASYGLITDGTSA